MSETTTDRRVHDATPAGNILCTEKLLARINLRGLTEQSLHEVFSNFMQQIIEHFGADHGWVLLKDGAGALQSAAAAPGGEESAAFSEAVVQETMQKGETLLIADASAERAADAILKKAGVQSVLCSPIKSDDVVQGAIYIDSVQGKLWQSPHADVIGFVAGYAALALDNLRLRAACAENKRVVAAGKATLNLSHSIKNILQMVSGAAEVVDFGLRTNQIHRVKRSWDILKPNLDRMKKYTLEMLDYSKERPLNPGPCDFNRVIQGAIESLKAQLKVKNAKINIRIDQKIPRLVLDGERIHEMALNVILNAIDVVDPHMGLVSVETRYDPERQMVLLSVTDNGPGMSDEMKEKIFTPFESDKKKFGTGLGMAIAKQIVDQHKGVIEIDSHLHRGTMFTISLPVTIATQTG